MNRLMAIFQMLLALVLGTTPSNFVPVTVPALNRHERRALEAMLNRANLNLRQREQLDALITRS